MIVNSALKARNVRLDKTDAPRQVVWITGVITMRLLKSVAAAALIVAVLPGQAMAKEEANTLTTGMVQMTLRVGETTQAQVLETFGGPNIATVDGNGDEMWVYDRHATVSSDSSGGFSIGIGVGGGGGGAGAVGGLGFGKKKSKSEQSSRSMMLIIKFNRTKVVSDFRSRSSSF